MSAHLFCAIALSCLLVTASCSNEPSGDGCAEGTALSQGECVPTGSIICETGTTYNAGSGRCDPDILGCASGTVLVDSECVPEGAAVAEITEAPEPNDRTGAGAFEVPEIGSAVTLGGCITPMNFDGELGLDADYDGFEFSVAEPSLLEIEVDGLGGLAGGFLVTTSHEVLSADRWTRIGVNLTGDTSRRQVYLPAAGTYLIEVGDSRAILFDEPAGSDNTCYFATVSSLPVPEPTPIVDTAAGSLAGPNFFRFEPGEADFLINSLAAPSSAAQGAIVQMVNGGYVGHSVHPSDDALGRDVETQLGGLAPTDEVVFVIEPVINFSINEVEFEFRIARQTVIELPSDGTLNLTPSELNQDALAYFDVAAGAIMHLAFTSADAEQLKAAIVDYRGQTVASICTLCRDFDGFIRVTQAGRYYLLVDNQESAPLDPFVVRIAQEIEQPTALLEPIVAKTLSANRNDFYRTTLRDLYWHGFTGSSEDFAGDMAVQVYDSTASGQLDLAVPSILNFQFSASAQLFGYIGDFAGHDREVLVRVSDTGLGAGERHYNLAIGERAMVDLGNASSNVFIESVESVASGEPSLFFVSTTANDRVTLRIGSDDGVDPIVRILGADEAVLESTNATSVGAEESIRRVTGRFMAFAVEGANNSSGAISIRIDAETPIAVTSRPLLQIDDGAPAGVEDALTMGACESISSVTVNTDIRHTWRGDLLMTLTSPEGTTVVLRNPSSSDSTDDYVGNFPTDFRVVGSLAAFKDQDGAGRWTLHLEDTFTGDLGILNAWTLNLFCL